MTRTPTSTRIRLSALPRSPRSRASLAVLAACGVLVCSTALAQRVAPGALPSGPVGMPSVAGVPALRGPEVVSGNFGAYTVNGNVGRIKQNDPAGILRWSTFDIGRDAKMVFEQPSSSSVVLNRVDGGAYLNQTVIEGMLQANGQVFIYNPNGVIIGRGARIDVAGLLASTLNIDNARFLKGLLSPSTDVSPQLLIDPAFVNNPGAIVVEADSSVIARNGGRIILAAPSVSNAGQLVSENGQVILAAGRQVFLTSSSDSNMRGLLVEVSNANQVSGTQSALSQATNTGSISVGEGNATLVGYAVNQLGTVSATTTVDNNGSIWLLARDGASLNNNIATPSRGGQLTLGTGSRTEILLAEKTEADGSRRSLADSDRKLDKVSRVLLSGETIRLESQAAISAKAGKVNIWAQSNPGSHDISSDAPIRDVAATTARVDIASGASIDVSGATGTRLPMESLSLAIELRGSQLADSPLLRNGALRGATAYVDVRKGTAIANISGDLALRTATLGELAARGGQVDIYADGAVKFASGASIDVSGGWIDYLSGRVPTSKLMLPSGRLVSISTARKDIAYKGVINNFLSGSRGVEAGYREGFSAGSVTFNGASLTLAGELSGRVVRGPQQRDPGAANWPLGASLIVGDLAKAFSTTSPYNPHLPSAVGDPSEYGFRGDVILGRRSQDDDNPDELHLDATALGERGFEHLKIAAGGSVNTAADIALPATGSLEIAAHDTVSLAHTITASGGTLKAAANRVEVAEGTRLDLAGQWINDLPRSKSRVGGKRDSAARLTETIATDGGILDFKGENAVTVGQNVAIDVSGGVQLTTAGKPIGGSAGSIALTTPTVLPGDARGLAIADSARLLGYGLDSGGALKLQGRDAYLGGASPFAGTQQVAGADALYDLWLGDGFFTQGGFSQVEIGAAGNAIIRAGAQIIPRQSNWFLGKAYARQGSGSMAFAETVQMPLSGPAGSRAASNLTVTARTENYADAGRVVMESGSRIETDPGGKIALKAGRQLTVDGTLVAPASSIALELSKGTPSSTDSTGYVAERSIWVGDNARLIAQGSTARMSTSRRGVASGEVLDGGTISIGGPGDATAVGHVVVAGGAVLDVSGVAGSYALRSDPRHPVEVASDGGSIDIRARESLLFAGTAKGSAGSPNALGGSFGATLDRENVVAPPSGYPTAALDLVVVADQVTLPGGLAQNATLSNQAGQGRVSAPMLAASGFDTISLKSQDKISLDFAGGTSLALNPRARLSLDAPVLAAANAAAGARARLSADHLALGSSDWRYQSAHSPSAGLASLALAASVVDLTGELALQGFQRTEIAASDALRLVGVSALDLSKGDSSKPTAVELKGALRLKGDLDITAGQVYPTTLSQYEIVAEAAAGPSSITIRGNGTTPQEPFSAAASLHLQADNIVQGGIVRAPLGELSFSANQALSFEPGSLTSVAASQLIPFGSVSNGREWIYDFGNGNYMNVGTDGAATTIALPNKRIVSEGASVAFKAGARIDLSGGGDLVASEFLPGPGGSKNVLANDGKTFAILPGYASAYAPVDPQNGVGSGLPAGARVWLAGGNGLAAGYYTLLPAQYALLPGAYSITLASGGRDVKSTRSVAQRDGSLLTAGRSTTGNTGLGDSRYATYSVAPGETTVRKQSEFGEYRASSFFAELAAAADEAMPTLPADGGNLVIDVGNDLLLKGDFLFGGANGRKGKLDLAATELVIVGDESAATPNGTVKVSVADLMRTGAGSLLLGGRRDADGIVTVKADHLTLANDRNSALVAPDITLAARQQLVIAENAAVHGSGETDAATLALAGDAANADGAVLRVTGQGLGEIVRNAPAGNDGVLDIRSGALVRGEGGVNLDATRRILLGQAPEIGAGGGFAIGTSKIALGDAIPASTYDVAFDSAALSDLSRLSRLSLTSYGGFDLFGQVALGSAGMNRLALYGAGFQGFAANAALQAKTVVLANSSRSAMTGTAPGSAAGNLVVQAGTIQFGSALDATASKAERVEAHDFAIDGFASTHLQASTEVRGTGYGKGALRVQSGDLLVSAPRITASGGADAALAATNGLLKTLQAGSNNGSQPVGGSLTLSGTTVSHGGTAVAASGKLRIEADGALVLEDGSVASATGQTLTLGDQTVHTGAGKVTLVSRNGSVFLGTPSGSGTGAVIDVSGHTAGGQLDISATAPGGRLVWRNNVAFKGSGASTQAGFSLDAGAIDDFGTLNSLLNTAGFGESREFRARSGNLQLAAGESIVARNILLAADQGDITLGGTLDARGASGGTIKVYAAQATAGDGQGNVTLESTARLLASATTAAASSAGSTGDGGQVEIGTATADGSMPVDQSSGSLLTVQSGALIDVAAAGNGDGGRVALRAPRIGVDEGQDVAIAGSLAGLVSGAADKMIEAFKVYDGVSTINSAAVATGAAWYQDTARFVTDNKTNILAALGTTDFRLQPGLEIRAPGDLLVSVNETASSANAANRGWNLDTWRFDGEPVSLTLRATDSLTLQGSISDGFVKPANARVAMPDWQLDPAGTNSASYRMVAAADFAAANPLAVQAREDSSGDFQIDFARSFGTSTDQPVALLRTGTGNIDIAAGHDIVLGSFETSAGEKLAAQIYTAGRPATTGSFTAPSIALNNSYLGSAATTKANAQYPVDGGDISLFAMNDVLGVATQQLFTDWLYRQGQTSIDSSGASVFVGATPLKSGYATSWWVQFDRFNQNLATFGGGDLQVAARQGNVVDLSVAAASTGYADGTPGTAVSERGGGNLTVQAGGDIRGGTFYAQKGDVRLTAGGDITYGERVVEYTDTVTGELVSLNTLPVIALGSGSAHILARGDAAIEGVLNPTLMPQSASNQLSVAANSSYSYFGTYTDNSGVDLTSLSGNARLRNSQNVLRRLNRVDPDTPRSVEGLDDGLNAFYTYYPGSLSMLAASGNIDVLAGFSMAPSATGQLSLLAAGSVTVGGGRQGDDASAIVMLDRDPALMPSTSRPAGYAAVEESLLGALGGATQGLAAHTSGGLHAGDSEPVRVVAAGGNIVGLADVDYTLVSAKAADIQAGGDIRNFGLYAQHLAADQVSRIRAGGSITAPTEIDGSSPVGFRIGGPGRFEMLAGKAIDFGNSQGLVSAGNSDNPYLPAVADYGTTTGYDAPRYGADLLLAAGLTQGLKAEDFLLSLPAASISPGLTEAARQTVADAGTPFRRADGTITTTPDAGEIWTAFASLPGDTRQALYQAQVSNINDSFFAAVIAQVKAEPTNLSAFDAILARYLGNAGSGGDINVFGSQIKTLRRGNIDIFAPHGSLYAGVVSTPASLLAAKTAAELGIFTISGGEIRIMVGQDISVNQGRIFTLGGGDISLVSQYQDIDAGRGAKTAASAPPPTLEFDAFGNARIDISSSVSGSGIRTLKTGAKVPLASIYAASPRGVFDAGDAGVGSSGSVDIVAASVLNAGNITASNGVSGVPAVDTSNVGGAVAAPTSQNTRPEDAVRSAIGKDGAMRGTTFLSVDVLGFGDGTESAPATGGDNKAGDGKRKELRK